MARYLKISALGPEPHSVDMTSDSKTIANKMIEHWQEQLSQILPDRPDMIVTPEVCDCPAHMPFEKMPDYFRVRGNSFLDFIRETANANNCYIAYSSYREMEDGTFRNSTQIIDRDGGIAGIYNKNYLFMPENTEAGALYGKEAPIIKCDFGEVACAICFDLNFDELRLKYSKAKPDIIIFSSMFHGGLMQNYWAYSCRSYFVGAVKGLPCSIISPVGQNIISGTNYHKYATAHINLDCAVVHLDYNWDGIKEAKTKYGEDFKVSDPGYLGSVLISSEAESKSINHIMDEYGIKPLDDYLNRSSMHRYGNIEP